MDRENNPLRRYAKYGLLGGTVIGLLLGVLVSGPHLHSWPTIDLAAVFFGSVALCAFVGYMFVPVIVGSLVRGPSIELGGSDSSLGPIGGYTGHDPAEYHGGEAVSTSVGGYGNDQGAP